MYYRAFPDLDFTPARVVVDGPHAAVEWAETFHFREDFDGIAADGREVRVRALDVFEIRDGLVVHESGWYGDAWLRRRLTDRDLSGLPTPLARVAGWDERVRAGRPAVDDFRGDTRRSSTGSSTRRRQA